ncbi:MAG: NAD-dependent epimerase/dehydratase family protein [Myxococcales bacterium]|nr:NAD-dependent epimerase/dehydratase family protein [Myxococcales bacterium]MCB9531645.1 NAD-dependent epimerase/dehydratase family protein [Myxococcales bacterium]
MSASHRFSRVLITGGEGFVGSHLAAHALAAGAEVTTLDDGSSIGGTGVPQHTMPGARLTAVRGSVLDRDCVNALVADADAVFHLAARVGVRRILVDPLATLDVNTIGTQNVLEACADRGVPVLYTSSSEVYGHGACVPFTESDPILLGSPDQTRWGYAVSKLHGELLGFALAAHRGLPFVAVRLFNVVGPGQRADQGMVLPRFVASAVAGEPIVVHGPGTQRRSFIHAADVADALWSLLGSHEGPAELVNVGSGDWISIHDLAERVRSVVGSESPIRIVDPDRVMPHGFVEVTDRWPNLERLRARVGQRQLVPLDTIIGQIAAATRAGSAA